MWRPVCLLSLLLLGCASARPVLYPNTKLERVGSEVAEVDVEECLILAEDAGAYRGGSEKAGDIAMDTATSAGAGAAAGAAGGAVRGGGRAGTWAGVGAAAGAAGAAVRGGLRWMFGRREPDGIKRAFVQRCLSERGYDVIGWK